MPYISVAIILDLLKIGWPYLDELYKEGEAGRRKISQYTRYGTIGLSLVQGWMIAYSLQSIQAPGGGSVVYHPGLNFILLTIITATAAFKPVYVADDLKKYGGVVPRISPCIFSGA